MRNLGAQCRCALLATLLLIGQSGASLAQNHSHSGGHVDSMKLIALEEEVAGVGSEAFTEAILAAEAQALWKLQQRGFVREAYFRTDEKLAVLVLEATSLAEAEEMLSTLPLVQAKLIRFKVIALRPYDGYERLFGAPHHSSARSSSENMDSTGTPK